MFVLVSTTRGDDLIAPQKSVTATSESRWDLQTFQDSRSAERAEFLARNVMPYGVEGMVIASEEIVEVPSV